MATASSDLTVRTVPAGLTAKYSFARESSCVWATLALSYTMNRNRVTPKRILAKLEVKNGSVVKGVMMEGVHRVGVPSTMCKDYYLQGCDEIIIHDVVASLYRRQELGEIIRDIVKDVFVPVCAGGGVNSCREAEILFKSGADRVLINTGALKDPRVILELTREFGEQAIVIQVDAQRVGGVYKPTFNYGRDLATYSLEEWLRVIEDYRVGEVMVTSVKLDGTCRGPDLELIDFVERHCSLQLIYSGGVSSADDISCVFERKQVQAVAVGAALHFKQTSILDLKRELTKQRHCVRH